MSLFLSASANAVSPNLTLSLLGGGGVEPYLYSVTNGGAGGLIDPSSGIYTAPPGTGADQIVVTDSIGQTASRIINVSAPIQLLCDILQTEMSLSPGRVYLWKQKWLQPKDNGLYIAVGIVSQKPFGNTRRMKTSTQLDAVLSVNTQALMSIDVMSRGKAARERKEEVLSAINSNYSCAQQERNSFSIAVIPTGFVDLSQMDGAAIPYRFNLTIAMQYFTTVAKSVNYFDSFETTSILTNQ